MDFSLSRQYEQINGPPLDKPIPGGDKTAPEHQDGKTLCNPFPTDVYYLGSLVRGYFMKVRVASVTGKLCLCIMTQTFQGFEFMALLVADMVQDDPPEHRDMETPYDPFPTDVYYLGNLVREGYIQVRPFICS